MKDFEENLFKPAEPILSEIANGKRESTISNEATTFMNHDNNLINLFQDSSLPTKIETDTIQVAIMNALSDAEEFKNTEHLINLEKLTKRARKYSYQFIHNNNNCGNNIQYHEQFLHHSNHIENVSTDIINRAQSLQQENVLISSKQRGLVDLFKVLKSNGISHRVNDVPFQCKQVQHIMSLPIPSLSVFLDSLPAEEENDTSLISQGIKVYMKKLWSRCDYYYYKNTSQLQRMRLSSHQSNKVS